MIDYTLILIYFYPDTKWTLTGDDYEGLDWSDATPKPTKAELDAKWQDAVNLREQKKIELAAAKAKLLDQLGLTAEEVKLLLA
jgi:hypothetical protein